MCYQYTRQQMQTTTENTYAERLEAFYKWQSKPQCCCNQPLTLVLNSSFGYVKKQIVYAGTFSGR